jgi:peroxiredoxin/uncharacterized membrane protein YphA (DoxX/SURF4 family)
MLPLLTMISKVSLALMFVTAGISKLLDLPGSRRALTEFGVPASLAAPLAVALPVGELGIALALVPAATAKWGAALALALLVCFVAGIAINLSLGRRPDCHCFGQLHSAPAGWGTLIRNAFFASAAGLVIWQEDRVDSLETVQSLSLLFGFAVLVVIAGQSWFIVHLLRQHGRILLRLDALEAAHGRTGPIRRDQGPERLTGGLSLGSLAPPFSLRNHGGEPVTLRSLRASGKPVMVIFVDANCGACTALMPQVRTWQTEHAAALTIVVVDRANPNQPVAKATVEHGITNLLFQEGREVAEAYGVAATPSAVIVSPDGTIGSPLALGPISIRDLVMQTAELTVNPTILPPPRDETDIGGSNGARPPVIALNIGDRVPALKLPDLSGKLTNPREIRGGKTLILFWNPSCPFCQRMVRDLNAY